MLMNGADALLRSLEAEGVETVFGIPGGAILPTYDALARGTTIRHVLARHEQGAGHMAQGFARASGRVGVAFATSGPGATNLVTPIADAWMDSTPLVCVTGQVRSHLIGTDAFQECDITGITIPIVKHSWLVQDVDELPHAIKAAFHVASTGRCGPVLVDIPRDVQEAEIDFSYPDSIDLPGWRPAATVNAKQVRAAAQAIADAQRPVLYVGGGTINAEACDELRALAELWQLPVVTTLMAKSSFPETHDLHFGWPGMHGAKWSNWAMNKCDVLVAVGARFDDRVTGKLSAFAPGATVVHLDVDAAEIGKLRRADIPVVGPLKQILAELASAFEALKEKGVRSQTNPWLAQLAGWREEFPLRYGDDGDMLKPQRVLETLQAQTSGRDDMIWTTGVGQHQMWAMQYLLCDRPRCFHHLGRPRHDGLRAPGRRRREGRPSGRDRRLHRRRRMLPDDLAGAGDLGDGGSADRRRDREQRLPGHGPAVAGHVLRGAVLAGPARAGLARLREARRGVRRRRPARRDRGRARRDARRGAGLRPHGGRRLPRRPGRALLPDDPGGSRRPRSRRVRTALGARAVIHTLSVLVEDKPGALMRISSMFARRGYNIESLAVGPTERQNVSRIVLRVDCEQRSLEQIEKQMHKLVNVLRVSELESGQAIERELALITVTAAPAQRAELLSIADVLGVRVADVGPNAIVFEVVGAPEQIDTFEELVRPHGIKELARTGRIGLARASVGRSSTKQLVPN